MNRGSVQKGLVMNKIGIYKSSFKIGLKFLLIESLILSFKIPVYAAQFELSENRVLRVEAEGSENSSILQKTGYLTKGSIVEVDDAYAVVQNGKLDYEASIQKWKSLKGSQKNNSPIHAKFNETQSDYFMPVQIIKKAEGSHVSKSESKINNKMYISLKRGVALAKTFAKTAEAPKQPVVVSLQKARVLLSENKDLYGQVYDTEVKFQADSKQSELESFCSDCDDMMRVVKEASVISTDQLLGIRDPISKFIEAQELKKRSSEEAQAAQSAASGVRKRVEWVVGKLNISLLPKELKSLGEIFNKVPQNFEDSTNIPFAKYLTHMGEKLKNTSYPPELLLAIMTKESQGFIDLHFKVKKGQVDTNKHPLNHGPFGIQDPATIREMGSCYDGNKAQHIYSVIDGASNVEQKLSNPDPQVNCVGNPYVNLKAAIQILDSKRERIEKREGQQVEPIATGQDVAKITSPRKIKALLFDYNGSPDHQRNYSETLTKFVEELQKQNVIRQVEVPVPAPASAPKLAQQKIKATKPQEIPYSGQGHDPLDLVD